MQADPPIQERLVLVDGSSYLYRAFHALPSLTTRQGAPTGAVYGVVNMLKKLLSEARPSHLAVVFDAKGRTFRDDIYPDYKATRPPMPEELDQQIEPLYECIRALGIPLLEVAGVEADDVIGTLAKRAVAEDIPVLISTGDKDMAQLVEGRITLVNTMDNTTLDEAKVQAKFGVAPERIVDYLALMGDKIDNIPGVDGVGPKTAAKWLNAYGSLDEVITQAGAVKGKAGESLQAAVETLPMSRELATIRCDLDLEYTPRELIQRLPDTKALQSLYRRLEFRGWLAEVDDASEAFAQDPPHATAYQLILTEAQLDDWLYTLQAADLFAFDTETTDLNYMKARVVGMSFAVESGQAAYLPLAHDYPDAPAQLNRDTVLARCKPLLEDPAHKKLGHNLKYDRNVLINHDIELSGIDHDTMLESYVLNSTASRHDLDTLCERHLAHTNIHFEEVAGKGAKQITFNQVLLEEALPYAAEDADMTLRLHAKLWPQLEQAAAQRALYEAIEMPMVEVLSRLECNGVLVDAERLAAQSEEFAARIEAVVTTAYQEAGCEFNLGSPKQIQDILFDRQGLPVRRKTPKGQPSTGEDVLQELALEYELPRLILEYRSLSKLKSTYIDTLPKQIHPDTGRVHTSYHQAVASTGRLSSAEPNLQNIPIRTHEGRRIRQAFTAPSGCRLIALDYSQIELRIMAHLSGDAGLAAAFERGQDVHRATAAEVFGAPEEQVDSEQRRAAKAINFGLIYGMSAFGLARQLGIERGAAQEYVDIYFARYPGVKAYMDNTRRQARAQGYVETLFGRRLYLPEINARNAQRRQYAERTAINAPMQGSAADIIKRAMITMDAWLQAERPAARMIMQVHDELVFEADEAEVERVKTAATERMTAAATLSVPLLVEAADGNNWDEAH